MTLHVTSALKYMDREIKIITNFLKIIYNTIFVSYVKTLMSRQYNGCIS